MTEVVVYPDASAVVVDYLLDELTDRADNAPVVTRVPSPRPTRFVLVRRVGGTRQTIVTDAASLSIESWGASEEEAMDLAQLVRGLVHAMQGTVQADVTVYRVQEFAGPALLPDPESDQPRVVQTMQVQLRGEAA